MEFLTPSEKLKKFRIDLGIRQHELEGADITRNFISMVESGKRRLSNKVADEVAAIIKRKALEKGIELDIDGEYLNSEPREDARRYCIKNSEAKLGDVDELIEIAKSYELQDSLAKTYEYKGEVLRGKNNINEAYDYYYKALTICDNINWNEAKASIYNRLSLCKYELLRFEEALIFLYKAENYAKLYEDKQTEKKVYHNMARCFIRLEDYKKALEYIEKCIALLDEEKDGEKYIETFMIRANCYLEMGDYDEALRLYDEVLNIQKEAGYDIYGMIYNNIGLIYSRKGEYDKALDYFEKAKLSYVENSKIDSAITIINAAEAKMKQGKYDEALALVDEALDLARRNNKASNISVALVIKENILKEIGDTERLKNLYMDMIDFYETIVDAEKVKELSTKLALLELNLGNVESAKKTMEKVVL